MQLRFRCLVLAALGALLLARVAADAPALPPLRHPGAGQVFYFLLTDRFANGSTANDRGGLPGGPDDHGFDPTSIGYYHGGDFAGLTARLDYIRQLGATAVWVTPPFRNRPVQRGSASYHGYWITDFLQIDPHLGTDAEFAAFVRAAHARGLRVYVDIVANHTADVIATEDGDTRYRDTTHWPYRDAAGRPFDLAAVASNGLGPADAFPPLDPLRSFAYVPVLAPGDAAAKRPEWLNDVTLYHHRGHSTFVGASSLDGDFGGLDDLLTEHPRVVRGFVDVYAYWIREYGIDGFRIDTAKHVNPEFWQAFLPAIHAQARAAGRPEFLAFGEVADDRGDAAFLSEFSTLAPLDATLDFGFFVAARDYLSRGGSAARLRALFEQDDWYTDHDSNVHATTTFLGNHDAGRFAYFLRRDNPAADDATLLELVRLGHALLFLVRGQPVVYYGDEQGMAGTGGDKEARESMFPSRAPHFAALPLLGTTRTGADDKFDPAHPLYRTIARLAALRQAHPALAHGAMHLRPAEDPAVFAFSRIERTERVEYLVAVNASRHVRRTTHVPSGRPPGARFQLLWDSRQPEAGPPQTRAPVEVDATGGVAVTLEPLHLLVWRAEAPWPAPAAAATPLRVRFADPVDDTRLAFATYEFAGITFPTRHEVRVEVTGGDGPAEVTFALHRASRPDQAEWLGTDDAAPYRVFWRPPADLDSEEVVTISATARDFRGQRHEARITGLTVDLAGVRPGIAGSTTPRLRSQPAADLAVATGGRLELDVRADGTGELTYQWFRDDEPVPGATAPRLVLAPAGPETAGRYRVLVRNLAGTTFGRETTVRVTP